MAPKKAWRHAATAGARLGSSMAIWPKSGIFPNTTSASCVANHNPNIHSNHFLTHLKLYWLKKSKPKYFQKTAFI
jgi:hypothetical protein